MAGTPIILNVHIEAVAGREAELTEKLLALVTPTRNEPGCITYKLHRDSLNPRKLMFYEVFANQEAFDAHINAPYFKKFLAYRDTGIDPVANQTVTTWSGLEASGS